MEVDENVLLETRVFSLAQTSWYSRAFCSRICCKRMYFMCSSTLRTQFSKRTTMRMRFGHVCMMDTKVLWSARSTSCPLIDKMTSPLFWVFVGYWNGEDFCRPMIGKWRVSFIPVFVSIIHLRGSVVLYLNGARLCGLDQADRHNQHKWWLQHRFRRGNGFHSSTIRDTQQIVIVSSILHFSFRTQAAIQMITSSHKQCIIECTKKFPFYAVLNRSTIWLRISYLSSLKNTLKYFWF